MTGAASPRDPGGKVRDWPEAKGWRETQPGRVVFTNGVFDLLHPGHVDVLMGARRQGDALIVAINSDDSVRRLKGPTRPVRSQASTYEQDTPLELIEHLRPDVLVKGGDYREETIVGASQVRAWGGSVVVIPLTPGQSTTNIIRVLRGEP